uniref:C-type cytochrome n=1 Tax=Schlesneria paludicola TaxID=360056 RepID=A0A7C4LM00_9PLAN
MSALPLLVCAALAANPVAEHRLAYLDGDDIYYPDARFPKLITPQWVGEAGVEAVVILAIDDMREPARYEAYLRPILQRLKQIDGRAPVSIMTCKVDPRDPQLQTWLQEGLSLEIHTVDHPCPLLQGGDFAKAKRTYDQCVDLLFSVPHNAPVAFRMPCCDSLNTVSPRFYKEIFNQTTPQGNFLHISSSVFQVYTAADPSIPRHLLFDAQGRERFRKYFPKGLKRGDQIHDRFVNYIENYPYPYVIDRLCWEFPCMTPSDWEGNHLHQPANPQTVEDLKAALDITVLKQGVFNLVFHPYGWIQAEQVNELIDHAVTRHGNKVKFLTFKEALERLNRHFLGGTPLRDERGNDNGVRLIDTDGDGLLEAVKSASKFDKPSLKLLQANKLPQGVVLPPAGAPLSLRLVDLNEDGHRDLVFSDAQRYGVWLFEPAAQAWTVELLSGQRGGQPAEEELPPIVRADGTDNGCFVRDRALHWQNEDTAHLPNLIVSWDFDKLLGNRMPDPKTPHAAVESMRPRPGFVVELMACEPMVADPVAMAWGPDGKFWVVEMADYPTGMDGRGRPGGRVRFLEDTDGDGQYDQSTLFLEGLPFPNGVHPWKNGVLISAAPDVLFAADTDGDGRADVREVLYTGFAEGNQQHRVNGFAYGLDGWLYLANGDSGGGITSLKTGEKLELRGRDLRIHPETGRMEAVSGQTQFGRNRDDGGHWFGNNNSRPMWHFVLEDYDLRRNPHYAPPDPKRDVSVTPGAARVYPASKTLARFNDFDRANRFTSACSAMVYRDRLFLDALGLSPPDASPDVGEAQLTFVSEPVHNLVHCEVMTPQGVSFTSRRLDDEQEREFLASTDNWFRPTQLQTGPDGALWIADMYRLVIEHPQWIPQEWQEKLQLRAGDDKGRIWRVYPAQTKLRPIPRLDRLSTAELVAALDDSNGWQRDMVQQLLLERRDAAAAAPLRELAEKAARPQTRLQALCTLAELEALPEDLFLRALADVHPLVRRQAVRLLGEWTARPATTAESRGGEHARPIFRNTAALASRVEQLCLDSDPGVRLQLALALGNFPQFAPRLAQLAQSSQGDKYLLAAVFSSLHEGNIAVFAQAVLRDPSSDTLSDDFVAELIGQLVAFTQPAGLSSLLGPAVELPLAKWSDREWKLVERFLTAMAKLGHPWKKWPAAGDPALAWTANLQERLVEAVRLAQTEETPATLRVAAARLSRYAEWTGHAAAEALGKLLQPTQPPEVQLAAVQLFAQRGEAAVTAVVIERWRELSPAVRTAARDALLGRPQGCGALLEALASGELSGTDFDAVARQRLLDHPDPSLRRRAGELLGVSTSSSRAEVISRYQPVVRQGGDVQRGGDVFRRTCAACHRLGEVGHAVGPDLRSLTDKSPEALLTAVLDPNRAVETRYLTFTAVTQQGQAFSGLLETETATSITLLAAEGKRNTLLRSELEQLASSNKSLMPEGLEKDLSPAALADLIAFIRANVPLPPRKEFPGNSPQTVSGDARGRIVLAPQTAEIYGPTIVLEEKYGNLGWWSSAEDHAVWTVNVPSTGRYAIIVDYACDPSAAGHRLVIDGGRQPLVHRVEPTASWDDYRQLPLGEITLEAGVQRITLRPAARPLPALLDLKSLTLVPVEENQAP